MMLIGFDIILQTSFALVNYDFRLSCKYHYSSSISFYISLCSAIIIIVLVILPNVVFGGS